MKLEIKNIINLHKNKPCITLGHGPHFNTVKHRFKELKDRGFIFISTNDWYSFQEEEIDYCVICNHVYSIARYYESMNRYKTVICYSDVQELTNREKVNSLLKVDYIPYDNIHFGNKICSPYPLWGYDVDGPVGNMTFKQTCCDHFIKDRLTLSEELQKFSGHIEHCGRGICNIDHQITLALLLGCNPIYVSGINFNAELGHATMDRIDKELNDYNRRADGAWQSDAEMKIIHNDFRILNESAKLLGVEIINLNKDLPYDEFKKGDLL